MIPCVSDDSGSVDLQLSSIEDIKNRPSSVENTGEWGKGKVGAGGRNSAAIKHEAMTECCLTSP